MRECWLYFTYTLLVLVVNEPLVCQGSSVFQTQSVKHD